MLRIMVVDDEKTVRRGIIQGVDWKNMGCTVVAEACNGMEALEEAEQCKPDVIVSDIRMPKMDGLKMAEELRRRGAVCSIIFLTAYGEFEYARRALHLGAVDYLLKPFRDQDLAAAIDRLRKPEDVRIELPSKADPDDAGKSKYVLQTIAYIKDHYRESNVSITNIADKLRVSEGHLSHLFKKETGMTVISYLTDYRIRKSMDLLQNQKAKVYEVAELVGYRDVSYFSSIFKKITGMSPTDYQSQNQKDEQEE